MSRKRGERTVPPRRVDEAYEAPWWTSAWHGRQVDKTYQAMLKKSGPTMELEIYRPEEGDDPNITFSADALDEVLISMRAWLYSRVHRFYGEHGDKGAKSAKITLTVELGETP
jgi:hypothetical protein